MKKLIFYPVLYLILSSFILACGNKDSESPAKQTNTFDTSIFKKIPSSKIESIGNFKKYTIDPQAVGSAFSTLIDLEKDGKPEIILSRFNKVSIPVPGGNLSIYKMGKDLNEWMKIDLLTEKDAVKFPNHTSVYDIDSDGDEDIFLAHGFLVCKFTEESCGGIIWFENLGNYKFKKHVVLNNQELFYHDVNFIDLDEDGIKDILTVGEERLLVGPGKFKEKSEIHWIKGTKNGNRFENKVRKIAEGAGAFIRLLDIDKDGDLDWASAEFFHGKGASFTWFEKLEGPTTANPAGKYKRHIIDDKSGPSIQLSFVEDFYGDGKIRAVGSNHVNNQTSTPDPWESAVYSFEIPSDPKKPWIKNRISEGIKSVPSSQTQMAPGIFGSGDLDNDGDKDILLSGDGDPDVFWLEQTSPGKFKTNVLQKNLTQAGGMVVSDINGDGKNEGIVTGYDKNIIYIFKHN